MIGLVKHGLLHSARNATVFPEEPSKSEFRQLTSENPEPALPSCLECRLERLYFFNLCDYAESLPENLEQEIP